MSKKKKCCDGKCADRLNKVGGQAVLEGVMMKAGTRTVTTCRKPEGDIVVYDGEFHSVRKKHKILNLPILRGVINFVEMMILSVNTLGKSADAMGIEEEDGKAEQWMKKHLGIRLTDFIMIISVILGLALSIVLFMFLPNLISGLIDKYLLQGVFGDWYSNANQVGLSAIIAAIEGFVKITIFLLYLWLVSLMSDIKRTFMYHGAEHKSIACFESGAELTPENAKNFKRFHPRCGTSFMFLMILLGIFAGLFVKILIPGLKVWAYTGIRLLILPLVMGIGYEILMLAGKHDNIFTRILSAPGLWVQRITTKEPTEDMLEIAIISIKCALRDDFPEFSEYWESRAWEKKPENGLDGEDAVEADGAQLESSVASLEETEAPLENTEAAFESVEATVESAEQKATEKSAEDLKNDAE